MLENLPVLIPLILKIFPYYSQNYSTWSPNQGQEKTKNFIYIMDVVLEISSRFLILVEICINYRLNRTNNA
jgi:hypothetical protein